METNLSNNSLVFGKNACPYIVSVEPLDDQCLIFQEINGTIQQTALPNVNWLLASKPLPKSTWKPLEGALHYKHEATYSTRETFLKARQFYRQYDTYSIYDPKESFMVKSGVTYFKDMQISDVSVLSFDIETTALKYNKNEKLLLISNTYRSQGKITRKLFAYDEYDSPLEMIEAWCDWVREMNPSIILGHNILGFDLKYLWDIARHFGGSLKLGRDGSDLTFARYESKFRKDQTQFLSYNKVHVFGREVIDTMFLSIKFDIAKKKYSSYGLKPIIAAESLEEKDRVFYDAAQIRHQYKNPEEWVKIKKYCETDSDDALKLYDLMAPTFFYFCQSVPKSWQGLTESATGSQLNSLFVRSYLQEGHSIPKATEGREFVGAISWGNPGIYNNCIKWDVASLYPSIMLQYEVYPKEKDPKKHFLQILQYFTDERLKNKKIAADEKSKYHNDLSESGKIAINSAYGMLGAQGISFNDPFQAARVTEIGREILKKAIKWATGKEYEDWNKNEGLDESQVRTVDGDSV